MSRSMLTTEILSRIHIEINSNTQGAVCCTGTAAYVGTVCLVGMTCWQVWDVQLQKVDDISFQFIVLACLL